MSGNLVSEPIFALTEDEKHSQVWLRLRKHLNDRLERARSILETHRDETVTAALRGEIKTLRYLLSLGDETSRPDYLTGEEWRTATQAARLE